MRSSGTMYYFDCKWWSDFSQEEECLFIGGLAHFIFRTIRYIPKNENYQNYIAPITMLDLMVTANPILLRKANQRDYRNLRALMYSELGESMIIKKEKERRIIPELVSRLFHHFCVNVKKVKLNLMWMHIEQYISTQFGYKAINPLFIVPNTKIVDTNVMVKLFKNMEIFIVFTISYDSTAKLWKYAETMKLDATFVANIIESIKILNSRALSSSSRFKHFIYIKPKSKISKFIDENQARFKKINWHLYQSTYKDNYWGDCRDCLYIAPLSH